MTLTKSTPGCNGSDAVAVPTGRPNAFVLRDDIRLIHLYHHPDCPLSGSDEVEVSRPFKPLLDLDDPRVRKALNLSPDRRGLFIPAGPLPTWGWLTTPESLGLTRHDCLYPGDDDPDDDLELDWDGDDWEDA